MGDELEQMGNANLWLKVNEGQHRPGQDLEPRRDEVLQQNPDGSLASAVLRDQSLHIVLSHHTESDTIGTQLLIYHPLSIHVLALLMPFSVFGTLARLGIHALASYDGQSIFPLAWVQAVGCGIMGLALGFKDPITKFYGPLYTAISSGFCGSLTTFSGWQLDVFLAWADASGWQRIWIYDAMDGLTRSLFTLAVSFASLNLGFRIATCLAPRAPVLSPPHPVLRWAITCISAALYILTIPIFIWVDHEWRALATAALVFSFPGTLTRYALSTYLNPLIASLPIGTLLANEVATTLLASFYIIQRARPFTGPISCSILQGLMDGYCGCMSTVSTFIAEVRTLNGKKALIYVALSFVMGQFLILIILGPAWWTGRVHEGDMCTF